MTSTAPPLRPALQIADWRARVSALYDAARAASDPEQGHRTWREGRAELFAHHPASPIAGNDELRTRGIEYWPYDPALRFVVPVQGGGPETELSIDTGDDLGVTLRRVGRVALPEPVGEGLDVWSVRQYGGGLFVPLRDRTAGETSYGGGRYLLDTAKGAWLGGHDGTVVLDLNFAYHPSCRYDDRWICPLAPPGNTVSARIEAGERL